MSGEIATTKGGKVDNSVSYTDSNGQTHSMNTSTSLADMQSLNTRGLFPAGEGAGYAGGILSAAIDGIKVAEALALSLQRKYS